MKKSEMFRERAEKIAVSFNQIKQNPMNLNVVMAHIGLLSLTMDEILREYADMMEALEENVDMVETIEKENESETL